MTWGLVATVGGSLIGGMMSSDASQSAANTQAASADKATALQREIYQNQVALNDPYRQMGLGAGNRLMTLLGLQGGPSAPNLDGGSSGGALTRDQIRAQLLPKYSTAAISGEPIYNGEGSPLIYPNASPASVDEAGLNAAIDQQMAGQSQNQSTVNGNTSDPAYGSLMKDFSMADYQADPGYQFRLDQGNRALMMSAAARGGLLSGAALKDAMAYNSGQASQEYQNAFDRFQVNRSNKLNPLQSLMGVGQTGTGAITNAAGNYGTNAGNNIIGAGNALASGRIGSANAWNSAMGQGISSYQQNQLMNNLFPNGGGNSSYGNESWRTQGNGMPPGYMG